MITTETMRTAMYNQGRADALDLRARAPGLDATAIIAEENKIPVFIPDFDYSGWDAGSPIKELVDGQWLVFTWLIPVNTAHYPGFRPYTHRAQCSLCHTKDPAAATSWVPAYGTSGMWKLDECYREDDGKVYRQTYDGDNVYRATELPDRWELVEAY